MSYLEQSSRHFCQHFKQRRTQQTFFTINLVSQQKTTKLYSSSQVKKQFKLLTVPFKPLRCCLWSDKLHVNCYVWKFCKDLFLNFRLIWCINQIVLFNGFLILFRSLHVYILKQFYSFQSRWIVALGIFTFLLCGLVNISHCSPRFQRMILLSSIRCEVV